LALRMSEDQMLAALGERFQDFAEQPAGTMVHAQHALQVEQSKVHPLEVVDDVAHHDLGGIEAKLALQLVDLDPLAMLPKQLDGARRPAPVRRDLDSAVLPADNKLTRHRDAEEMQREISGELVADLDAAHAVPLLVQRWREDADAQPSRQHGQNAARHPAL